MEGKLIVKPEDLDPCGVQGDPLAETHDSEEDQEKKPILGPGDSYPE